MNLIVFINGTAFSNNQDEKNSVPYRFFQQVVSGSLKDKYHLSEPLSGPCGFSGVLYGEGEHGYDANLIRVKSLITEHIKTHGVFNRLVLFGHSRGGLIFSEVASWMKIVYPSIRIDILTGDITSGPGGSSRELAVGDNVVTWINIVPNQSPDWWKPSIQKNLNINHQGDLIQCSGRVFIQGNHNSVIYVHKREQCERMYAILWAFWQGMYTCGAPLVDHEENYRSTRDGVKINYFEYGEIILKNNDILAMVQRQVDFIKEETRYSFPGFRLQNVEEQAIHWLEKISPAKQLLRMATSNWPAVIQEHISGSSLLAYVSSQIGWVFRVVEVNPEYEAAKKQIAKRIDMIINYQDADIYFAQREQLIAVNKVFKKENALWKIFFTLFDGIQDINGRVRLGRLFTSGNKSERQDYLILPKLCVCGVAAEEIKQVLQDDICIQGADEVFEVKQSPSFK